MRSIEKVKILLGSWLSKGIKKNVISWLMKKWNAMIIQKKKKGKRNGTPWHLQFILNEIWDLGAELHVVSTVNVAANVLPREGVRN